MERRRMKNRLGKGLARARRIALAFLCCAGVIFANGLRVYAQDAQEVNAAYGYKNAPVAMEASYGYDNMAKGGRYLPVYITLTNQLDKVFNGTVSVRSMEADDNIYEYAYPVSLESRQTRQVNLNIPLGLRSDQLYVQLYDQEETLIVKKRLKINIRRDTPELLIGTLSDSQDKLEYLNGVGIHYSTLLTRTCAMVAGSISEQAAGLDQLDVLLITNYDIRRLSISQIETIKEWVSRGGILLLGTGAGGQEAIETFLENNIEGELPDPQEQIVDMGQEFAIYGPEDVQLSLTTTQVKISDGMEVLTSQGLPVLTAVNREKGMIAASIYDFSDISSFCQEHPYVDKLFTSLLGEDRIGELADYLFDNGYNTYWEVQGVINSGTIDKLPQISLYAIAIFSYILLAGPGLYFFLKQRGLRRRYPHFVTALSLFASSLIYLMSSKTRFEDSFFHYASIRDYAEDTIVESTYINMQTPYNRSFSVWLDPSYDIRPITRMQGNDREEFSRFTGEEAPDIRIDYKEEGTRLMVRDAGAFSPNYFHLEKRSQNEEDQGLSGKVYSFDGRLSGEVTNNLDVSLEKAAVLCSGAMVLIDEIKAGETVSLQDLPVLYYPKARSFITADRISGGYRFAQAEVDSPEYMTAVNRSNSLRFYLDNLLTGYQYGARLMGFVSREEKNGIFQGQDIDVQGYSLYTTSLETECREGNKVYHTSLERQPKVVNGSYSAEKNTMDGMSPLTLEYDLGRGIRVEKVRFISVSEEFLENPKYGVFPLFNGELYFYNYHTGNYDQMEQGQEEFADWQLEPYLSEDNKLTVKYAYDKEYLPDIELPVIAVVGTEGKR